MSTSILYQLPVLVVFAVWFAMLVCFRRMLRNPTFEDNKREIRSLDWAELSFLSFDGPRRVYQAAVVWYVQNGYATVSPKTYEVVPSKPLPDDAPIAVRMIEEKLRATRGTFSTEGLYSVVEKCYLRHFKYLQVEGFMAPLSRSLQIHVLGVAQFFAPVIIVIACDKFNFRYRDFMSLFFADAGQESAINDIWVLGPGLQMYSFFLAGWAILTRWRWSSSGQKAIRENQHRLWPNRGLFQMFGPVPNADNNLALAVALFDIFILKHTPLSHLMDALSPPSEPSCGM